MSIEITKPMNDQAYSYINLDYMDMMSDGDVEMKKVMIDMLLDELPTELDKMAQLTQGAEWGELGSVSHNMKSTLSFVGNDVMTESNKNIELYAKDRQHLDQIPVLMANLQSLAPKALDELRAELERC